MSVSFVKIVHVHMYTCINVYRHASSYLVVSLIDSFVFVSEGRDDSNGLMSPIITVFFLFCAAFFSSSLCLQLSISML